MFPRWLTFITESDGRTLNETNGVVSSSNARTPLQPTADVGEIKVGWERDNDFLGLGRIFSFPVSLYRTAAKIARNEFYKRNVERKLLFLLTKLTLDYNSTTIPATYKRYYKTLYKGEIDIPSTKDGDFKITFNLHEGGTDQQLKAKKDTVYEIPMDDPEAIWVKIDGTDLYDTANYLVTAIDQKTVFGPGTGRYLPAALVSRDGSASGFAGFQNSGITTYNEPPPIEEAHFMTSQVLTGMRIIGKIKVQIDFNYTPSIPYQASEKYVLCLNSNQRQGSVFNTPGIAYLNPNGKNGEPLHNQLNTVEFDFDVTFDSLQDEYFFIYAYGPPFGSSVVKFEYIETSFRIEFHSRYKTTFVKAFLPETVNKRLVKNITGSEDKAVSTLITANNNLALSCINAVRGLERSVMKTKYSDFFKFCRVQMVGGLGIENEKIVIEDIEYFLNTNEVEDLGEVKNLEIEYDKDRMANTYEVGYDEQTYDNVNGRYEFNNKHLYESPITKVVKKFELICPYRADCFGIEILRINLDGKTTTDNDSDNDVCILDIDLANPQTDPDLGTYYNLRRVVYDNWNDPDDFRLPSPSTVFNVEIRPEILLQKHAKWINSMMYGFDGDKLVYRTTPKNTIKTVLGSIVTDGKSDYVVKNDRIFIPRTLSFDTDIDADLIRRMQQNSKRCFRITDTDGTTYVGFPWRFGVEPDSLKEQPFILLSTKDNNFLKRIR